MSLSYRDAGVDLEAAEVVTARMRERIGATLFGGFVPVPALRSYDMPVLVSSIDGIGTKVALAAEGSFRPNPDFAGEYLDNTSCQLIVRSRRATLATLPTARGDIELIYRNLRRAKSV